MKPENGGTDDVDGVKRVDYSGKQHGCIWSNCALQLKWKLFWKPSSIFCTYHQTLLGSFITITL